LTGSLRRARVAGDWHRQCGMDYGCCFRGGGRCVFALVV